MNASTYFKVQNLYRELDRKRTKLGNIPAGDGRDKALKSLRKLERHIENVKGRNDAGQ